VHYSHIFLAYHSDSLLSENLVIHLRPRLARHQTLGCMAVVSWDICLFCFFEVLIADLSPTLVGITKPVFTPTLQYVPQWLVACCRPIAVIATPETCCDFDWNGCAHTHYVLIPCLSL
jgi:hypothetical protein